MTASPSLQNVLDFWFGAPGAPDFGLPREAWFRKDPAFDAAIRDEFGALVADAIAGELPAPDEPRATLAQIILLDQFTRNIHRGTAQAFAGDARALALAERLVATGGEAQLAPLERAFCYLPFEHAESLALQERSVALYAALQREHPADWSDSYLDYARQHAEIIRRFGRFPHRNAILGRASTPEELAFLEQPGSAF